MKLKTRILGGAAVAALMGALSFSAPAMAFTHHPGTPAEHAQTEDLNAQALQQAQSGTTAADPVVAPAMDQSVQAAPKSADQTAQAAPAPDLTMAGNVSLDSISNSPQTLDNASVEASNGQAVGAVQRVITDAAGKAKTVVVALLGKASRLVAIAANQLTFDQLRNVVVARLTADQIDSLPIAPQS